MGVLFFELALTRIYSVILWYDYAFMAVSVAFFGLGIGAFLVHVQKDKLKGSSHEKQQQLLLSKTTRSTIAFAISLPVFVALVGHMPSDTSFIYLYYLVSSVPFFFAGISMALIFFAMPREVNKLYFADLAGAALATLLLDPLMQRFGAESALVLISISLVCTPVLAAVALSSKNKSQGTTTISLKAKVATKKIKSLSAVVALGCAVLLIANVSIPVILAIPPGVTKGLHQQLANPAVEHLFTHWNSFSRVDVTRPNYNTDKMSGGPVEAATIIIDADAVTPVLRWNGLQSDILWIRNYMDYLPYQMHNANSTLVIGSGGGEDILVALAAGVKKVTAVELNPLIVSAARQFGSLSGNLYNRSDVSLFIDDGRRFISSTDSKYDSITIKLVDSWAAQLAGAYALTENYLYTTEAFKQYLAHLNDNGMLVMVRWNTELPRLMPLVVASLRETGKSDEEISREVMVVEDRPGLYFGSDPARTLYPVLVMVKNGPFTDSQVSLAKRTAEANGAEIIALPDLYIKPPYDRLLPGIKNEQSAAGPAVTNNSGSTPTVTLNQMKPPTDDSPFYFAKEPVPKQMVTLLITVLAISAVLAFLLVVYAKKKQVKLNSTSRFYLVFVALIGLGFMFLEVTFIQKFLLLLGTPIMALTVILFSILLSSGIGAYLSGKVFLNKPHKAVLFSIPILAGILLLYYGFLGDIIYSSIPVPLYQRIALTFGLLSPVAVLMGFQFPSIIRMASLHFNNDGDNDTTLLWGVNVIASVTGTIFAATLAMVIGFSGNLLIGFGLYTGALLSVILVSVAPSIKIQR
jgi:predicted membrane-bound spermidine synthase